MKKLLLLIVFAIALTNVYSATTYTWTGTSGGTWGTTTNWNPNGTPIAGDSVVINTASAMSIALGGVQVVKGITFMGGGTITFTATATQTFTATHIKVDGSPVVFSADQVTINSSLTFNGGSSKITHTPVTAGKAFTLGGGVGFILSGNTATNCLDGNANAQYNFNTTNSLIAYFNPTNIFHTFQISKGTITLGTNLQTNRLILSSTNSVNLNLNGNTFTVTGAGSSGLTNTAATTGIDASVAGSKVVIASSGSFLNVTGRIFKDATTIDNLEMSSSGNTFISAYPLSVKNLILTAGTINNSTNNITLTNGGSIIRSNQAGLLTSPPIFGTTSTDRVNVNYIASVTTANELLGSMGAIGTLSINDGVTATLSNSGISKITLSGTLTGYSNPTVSISAPNTGGITATATLTTSGTSPNKTITGICITNPGSGYVTTPTVTISEGSSWTTTPTLFSQNPTSCDNITVGQGATGTLTYPNSTNVVTLNVKNNITINSGASFLCGTQTNAVTHLLNVGGSITNSGTFTPITTALTKVVDITLNGTSANQNLCAATFNNLTINNTASSNPGVTLTGAVTVNNALTFTAGKLTLGANNLTIGSSGSISGASLSNYIVTNGAGLLSQSVTASTPKSFPIGASTSSYDPAIINPTTSLIYSAGVGSALSGTPTVSSYANSRQWNIVQATGTPTATITLTPSTSSNTSNPVIGFYNGTAWTEATASLSGTSFTGTHTFGSTNNFATGSRDAFFTTSRYWVGGASGNWDVASNWSYSSGGVAGAPVPAVGTTTTGNNVYFDANSGGTVAVALGSTLGTSTTALNSVNFTSSNVTFSGAYAIYNNTMTLTNSPVTFNADAVIVNSSLTFAGASSKITYNPVNTNKPFILGNGNSFTLTGNNETSCLDGNAYAYYTFNTLSPLTAYFNPNNVYYQVILQRGIITLGTNLQTTRFSTGTTTTGAPANNMGLVLNGNTLTVTGIGGSTLTNSSVVNQGIDASTTGSKVVISTSNVSFLNATGRIFKDATTIDNLEFNSSGNTFAPSYPLTVNNLTLTAGTINTSNNIAIVPGGKLTLSTGTLITNNGITLQSTALGTATMLNSGTFSGTINAEQYLGSARNWYVSSPVQVTNSPANNITRYYEYVETGDNADLGVTGSTAYWKGLSTGTAMTVGKGYIAQASAETTVQFSGTPNNGNITTSFNLTRDDAKGKGFNLVGNPYPSYLDWSLVYAANQNLMSTAWFKTKKTTEFGGGYVFATVNISPSQTVEIVANNANTTITKYIPPMQAFWVRVKSGTSSTSMSFTNDMREHRLDNGDLMKAPKVTERSRLRLQLINGIESDETLIYFDKIATNDFNEYDSPKMMNNSAVTPDLYTKAGVERLVINGMNVITDNMELPLGFSLNAAASLKLKATEMSNFPLGTRIYLLDKVELTKVELLPETEYSFKTTTATTNNESRFSLIFRAPGNTTGVDNANQINAQVFVNAANQIAIIAPEKCNYAIYNAMGQLIENGVLNTKSETINTKLNDGVYVVKVGNQSTRVILK
ncbi:MAG: T9SS type A sorting domain-containing protein [Paludibacter sp.]